MQETSGTYPPENQQNAEERIRELIETSPLPGLVWPDYEGGCITHLSDVILSTVGRNAQVPPSLEAFARPADRLVFIILDGLGYYSLAHFRERSASLDRILSEAEIQAITSTFPSTTPAALTSLYTGAAPREHGFMGGNVYLREKGTAANLLRFSPMEDLRRDVFVEQGINPEAFCAASSVFHRVGRRQAGAARVPKGIHGNALNRICVSGASQVIPYLTPAQALAGVRRAFKEDRTRFCILYWDATDSLSHLKGPYSEEYGAEVASFFRTLDEELLNADFGGERVKMLLSADHGHASVRKSSIMQFKDYPAIIQNLAAPPLGGTRVPYLQALPGREDALREACRVLEDRYFVLDSQEMREKGLWGTGKENPEARHRIGTLILVPKGDTTLHRTEPVFFTAAVRGDHDALSAEEMIVPLVKWER